MSQELIYTSAPRGLKPGSRGFCTVQSTQGMARNLADQLESLSGYRHVFPPHDPQAALNPVAWSHFKLTVGGRPMHVLSRIADAGLDYTQRTNKFVHHVVLDPDELVPAGPVWLLGSGLMQTTWDGTPRILPRGRAMPSGEVRPAVCQAWKALTGDAGWAGVLAETVAGGANQQAVIVFRPGMDLLPLLAEAVALVPPADRWGATFTTYFTRLSPGVTCNWRCVLADSPEALAATRTPHAVVIDLCRPLGHAPASALVESARTGQQVAALWDRKVPASPPPMDREPVWADEPPQLHAAAEEEPAPATPPPRRTAGDELLPSAGPPPRPGSRPAHLPMVFDHEPAPRRSPMPWIAVGISALLLAGSGGAALWTYFNVTSAQQIAQQQASGKESTQKQKEAKAEPKPEPQAEVTEPAEPPAQGGKAMSAPPQDTPAGDAPKPDPASAMDAKMPKEPEPNEANPAEPAAETPAGTKETGDTKEPGNGKGGAQGKKQSPPKEPAAEAVAASGKANGAESASDTKKTEESPKAEPEPNPFDGFPRFAERGVNQWKINIETSIPNIDAVYLLGTPQFYKDKLFEIQQSGEPTPNVPTWNIIYEDKTAGIPKMIVGWIKFQDNLVTISFKIDGTCIYDIEMGGLTLVSGTHSHTILLHNPNKYIQLPAGATTSKSRTYKDAKPFRPTQKIGSFAPSGIDDLEWPEMATNVVPWSVVHNQIKCPTAPSTTVRITPIEGKNHAVEYSLETREGNGRLTIIPKLKLDIAAPGLLPQADRDAAATKSISQQLSFWPSKLSSYASSQQDVVNRAKRAHDDAEAEARKQKDEKSAAKARQLKADYEKEQQRLQAIQDFQNDISMLDEYFDAIFSEKPDLRIDFDIYAVVNDPKDENHKLEMLMYTTDPDWQTRLIVPVVPKEPSE